MQHREGSDVTVVAYGGIVGSAISAAESLAEDGIECEIVDPRTLIPLDLEPIVESVRKTNGLVIVHEAPRFGGFGGEIAAQVMERTVAHLDAPLERVGGPFSPIPYAPNLAEKWVPDVEDIETAVLETLEARR